MKDHHQDSRSEETLQRAHAEDASSEQTFADLRSFPPPPLRFRGQNTPGAMGHEEARSTRPGDAETDREPGGWHEKGISPDRKEDAIVQMASVIQTRFNPARTKKKAHLRKKDQWSAHHGPAIAAGTEILADDAKNEIQNRRRLPNVRWKPAIVIDPNQNVQQIGDDQVGYIRANKVRFTAPDLRTILKANIFEILTQCENDFPILNGFLHTEAVAESLLINGLRYEHPHNKWGDETDPIRFANAFSLNQAVFRKIRDGARFSAHMIEYWRSRLDEDAVVDRMEFKDSDLHENGLGVIFVTYRRPGGFRKPAGQKFAGAANEVEVVLKPEDKSLEKHLIGSDPASAANQISDEAGLVGNDRIPTLKMETTTDRGSMVGKAPGESMKMKAKRLATAAGQDPQNLNDGQLKALLPKNDAIAPAFKETLTFAYIAGISDLHFENVFMDQGRPYLIDADNVLDYNQMVHEGLGARNQSGFSTFNQQETTAHREAMTDLDPGYQGGEIYRTLKEDQGARTRIFNILRNAIQGQKARVVPIYTKQWANRLVAYKTGTPVERNNILDTWSAENMIVGRAGRLEFGPGLYGNCYRNANNPHYDQGLERLNLRLDFENGVIPFYEYHFDSGHVTHNGDVIYHGQTGEQAINHLEEAFDDAQQGEDIAHMFA